MAFKTDARLGLGGKQAGTIGSDSGAAGVPSAAESTTAVAAVKSRVPLFDASGRCVAVIVDDVLTKSIDFSKHTLTNPPAIALDAVAVAEAEAAGVTQIVVTDRESGRTYTSSLADFMAHSWTLNRGYGLQRAMRLACWHVDGDEPAPVIAPEPAQPGPVAVQLALW